MIIFLFAFVEVLHVYVHDVPHQNVCAATLWKTVQMELSEN